MEYKIIGEKGLIFGDLHISDRYTGRHKNYLANCFTIMADIEKICLVENPSFIVFLGDIVGVRETQIRQREVLSVVCQFFGRLNKITDNRVYVVRGNHDFGDFPEFQFLHSLGLIKTSQDCDGYLDYYGEIENTLPEIRFHLVDYGKERDELPLHESDDVTDIVLCHNNITISGVTTWYNAHDGIELCYQENWKGVSMVFAGHIHNPSPELYTVDMGDDYTCSLFYLGCPTRPAYEKRGMYEQVWYVSFSYDAESKSTSWDANPFELPTVEETFILDEDFIEDRPQEELDEMQRSADLKNILGEIIKSRIVTGDLIKQVEVIPNASPEAISVAQKFIRLAMDRTT